MGGLVAGRARAGNQPWLGDERREPVAIRNEG